MIKIKLISVGALSEPYFRDAEAEYAKRLSRYCAFEEIRIKEARLGRASSGTVPSSSDITAALDREAEEILRHIPRRAAVFAMCIEGKMFSSEQFAEEIDRRASSGTSEFCFIIGSSCGLSDVVKAAADVKMSMSPMTFPHQLASVILTEELYRAMNMLNGGKYHK